MLSSIAAPIRPRNRTAFFLIALLIVAPAGHAADPDYSGVNDILRGRRALLAVNDLVIGGTVLKTSDGTKLEDKNISKVPGFQRNLVDAEIMAHMFDSQSETLVYANASALYAVAYTQLQQIANNIQLLSGAQTSRTDTSTSTERATWTTETTEGAT